MSVAKHFPLLISLVSLMVYSPLQSQDMLGLSLSNYAGISSVWINPATLNTSKYYMDFNLLTAGATFNNNYLYIHANDHNLLNYLTGGPYPSYGESQSLVDYSLSKTEKYGFAHARVMGPAGMAVYNKHAFGLQFNFRSHSAFSGLPYDIANYIYESIDYYPQHNILYSHADPSRMASLTYLEMALSYSYVIHRNRWDFLSAGISVKPIAGISGFYANLKNVDYLVENDSLAYIYDMSLDYGYSFPVSYADNSYIDGPLFRGYGIGIDLGFMYQKTTTGHSTAKYNRLCEQPYEKYRYRFGLAFLDIGKLFFAKKAETHEFVHTNTVWIKEYDTLPENSMEDINTKLDHYFSDYSGQSLKDSRFSMMLPAAVSMQAEYAFRDYLFLSGLAIIGIPAGATNLRRPHVLALVPRYETARMEISIPFSWYEFHWANPGIGLFFRYNNFFVGTDRLGSLFGLSDFTGGDFYFGVKLNLSRNLRMNFLRGNCSQQNYYNIETFDFRNF